LKRLNALLWMVLLVGSVSGQGKRESFDLVVYGGTAGGVMTAVAGAREGLQVAIVEPSRHLGGMLTKPDVIGMGSYNSDSHNVQRYVQPDGMAQNEGNMEVGVKPYQIPYRVLLPKRSQATNLLVPVCFSASHVVYSTLRMEPQYMIIGQAAGVAAKMAIEGKKAVQEIDAAALSDRLRELGAVFTWNPPSQ
jgi:hypothetical protein